MTSRNSFTIKLTPEQQGVLTNLLNTGNYRPLQVPHTSIAAQGQECTIALYTSGKCLVQGKGTEEWVSFTLEPLVLMEARLGYEEVHDPARSQPHMGVDESGKGDFFGPMVIAAAYVDEKLVTTFRDLEVRDSKRITSDSKAQALARGHSRGPGQSVCRGHDRPAGLQPPLCEDAQREQDPRVGSCQGN